MKKFSGSIKDKKSPSGICWMGISNICHLRWQNAQVNRVDRLSTCWQCTIFFYFLCTIIRWFYSNLRCKVLKMPIFLCKYGIKSWHLCFCMLELSVEKTKSHAQRQSCTAFECSLCWFYNANHRIEQIVITDFHPQFHCSNFTSCAAKSQHKNCEFVWMHKKYVLKS